MRLFDWATKAGQHSQIGQQKQKAEQQKE